MSRRLVLIVISVIWAGYSHALELGLSLSSSTEYTDNATFTREDQQEEIEQVFSADFSATETRKNFELDAALNLNRSTYVNGVFDDQTSVSTGVGVLNFNIIESLLTWETEYNRSQELRDPFGPQAEDNYDRRDTFETGPTVSYVISAIDRMTFSSRYINTENSDPALADTTRSSTQTAYYRYLDNLTESNINLGYENIIKPDGARDYDKYSAGVGLTRQISNGVMTLSAGRSLLEDDRGFKENSNNYSFLIQKQSVFSHDVFFSFSESISDTSLGFSPVPIAANDQEGVPPQNLELIDNAYEINSVVKRRVFGTGLSRDFSTFTYGLNYSWERDRAVEVYDVSYGKSLSLAVGTQLAPLTRLSFNSTYGKSSTKSPVTLTRTRSLTNSIGINHSVTQDFSMSGSCSYNVQKNQNDQRTDSFSVNFGLVWALL